MILTIIGVILIFGLLIFIHEFGHYITARLFKIGVNEFALGMGPAIFSHTSRKSGIKYSLRLLPIGGYVSMVGEDRLEGDDDVAAALCKRPAWQRFIVMFAGAAMNIILGFVIMTVLVLQQDVFYGTTVEGFVYQDDNGRNYATDCNFAGNGLMVGDSIIRVGNEDIRIYDDLTFEIMRVGAEPTDITVIRDGVRTVIKDYRFPTFTDNGIVFANPNFIIPDTLDKSPLTIIHQIFMQTVSKVRMIYETLIDTISGRYGMEAISGPVGTVKILDDTVKQTKSDYRVQVILSFIMLLTINLGIMNLLPFPALDGGRIFFILIELIRGKPMKTEHEGYIHFVGLVVLMLFMVFVTFNDIVRLIGG